jgi:hypothetical protein
VVFFHQFETSRFHVPDRKSQAITGFSKHLSGFQAALRLASVAERK